MQTPFARPKPLSEHFEALPEAGRPCTLILPTINVKKSSPFSYYYDNKEFYTSEVKAIETPEEAEFAKAFGLEVDISECSSKQRKRAIEVHGDVPLRKFKHITTGVRRIAGGMVETPDDICFQPKRHETPYGDIHSTMLTFKKAGNSRESEIALCCDHLIPILNFARSKGGVFDLRFPAISEFEDRPLELFNDREKVRKIISTLMSAKNILFSPEIYAPFGESRTIKLTRP